jgi:hypothetical protein
MRHEILLHTHVRTYTTCMCVHIKPSCTLSIQCIHTYSYTCIHNMHVRVYKRFMHTEYSMHTCIHTVIHAYTTCMCVHIKPSCTLSIQCIHTYSYTCIHNMHVRAYKTFMHTKYSMHAYIHACIHTCMHTYMHTYMQTQQACVCT